MAWMLASLLLITVPRRTLIPSYHYPHLYSHHLSTVATKVASMTTTTTTTGGNYQQPRPSQHLKTSSAPFGSFVLCSHPLTSSDTLSCRLASTSNNMDSFSSIEKKDSISRSESAILTSTVGEFLLLVKRMVINDGYCELADGDSRKEQLPHLVLGNSAGDADSVISAIGLAYVDSLLSSTRADLTGTGVGNVNVSSTSGCFEATTVATTTIPIISIPLEELKSQRPEIKFLLQDCAGLRKDLDEYFIAFDNQTGLLPDRATLTLVDHNYFHGGGTSRNAKTDEWIVNEIVDHHLDEKQHLDTCPPGPLRNIAFDETSKTPTVASTCTLIVERFFNSANKGNSNNMPPSLAILLLGVILLDSVNMLPAAGKGTARDASAIGALLDRTNWTQLSSPSLPKEVMDATCCQPDPTKLFECLQAQKFSPVFWQNLTALQAIRMDYKSFPISTCRSNIRHGDEKPILAVGISTILLDMDTFWNTKKDIERTIFCEMKEQNLQVLGLMFAFMEGADDGIVDSANINLQRQLVLASTNKIMLDQLIAYLLNNGTAASALQLSKRGTMSKTIMNVGATHAADNHESMLYIARMNQGNVASSRKQVAPVLMGFWTQERSRN